MTRRRPGPALTPPESPFEAVATAGEQVVADELRQVLEAVAEYDQGSIKGVLYQKPSNGQGSYKWIDDILMPFDFSAIFADMRERFGGGDFQLRVFAGGRIRKNVDFSIARERTPAVVAPAVPVGLAGLGGGSDILALIMNQQAAASERQMSMFMAMSDSQTKLLAAVLPALAGGGGGKASDTVALISALQDRKGAGGGLKETLEAMAAFKQLMGHDGGDDRGGANGFDPDDLVASGARLIGPVAKALGDYVSRLREGGEAGATSARLEPAPGAGDHLALGAPASRYRLLDLVRVDVTYMFERGHDPAKAADMVYDVIEANHVTEAEINELAATFALSPTGLDDLAAEGIDLRARPGWAAEFFSELAAIHSSEADGSDRGDGRAPNPAGHGAPGAPGVEGPAHPQ